MDTLDKTKWDVLIVGTGLQQSLLALALSRSGLKILHVDENRFYGGAEAALSLNEAEGWAKTVNGDVFSCASVSHPHVPASESGSSLLSPRSYSLELSPQLLYARSTLLQYLVSSKVYRQLEFLAVGTWWVYSPEAPAANDALSPSSEDELPRRGTLLKVPSGREDVFNDRVSSFKAKRALVKFLHFIAEYEDQPEVWEEHRKQPFSVFLSEQFKVPAPLQAPLLALTLSTASSNHTTTEYSLPRIARHLRSIGVFGPGFGAVLPKWGGMSEIVQVACRSCAVGGGIYVLGRGLSDSIDTPAVDETSEGITVRLKDGESVTTRWVVEQGAQDPDQASKCCKSITIVASPLTSLFPSLAEDAPSPASAVVTFPPGSLSLESESQVHELPPVHVFVHSSDTGECPDNQSILYASTSLDGEHGFQLLKKAIEALLSAVDVIPTPPILWSLQFQQGSSTTVNSVSSVSNEHILKFSASSLDLAFDDATLDRVRHVWEKIVGDDDTDFLVFDDREAYVDDDE